jgi:hypothetical protein
LWCEIQEGASDLKPEIVKEPRVSPQGQVKAKKPRGRGDAEIVTGGAWRADTVREEAEMVTGETW